MTPRIVAHSDPAVAEALERGEGWPRVGREVARRFAVVPSTHLLAHDAAGELLGAVSLIVHQDAGAGALGWMSGLVVLPKARGQGVGRALVREALTFAESNGARTVGLDATTQGRPLYESEGFRAVGRIARWERPAEAPRPVPVAPATSSIYPISSCEIMEVLAYDAPRFGAGRSSWLAGIIGELPNQAFVAFDKSSGTMTGLALGQERFIGPVVADSPEIAARLLYACERAGAPALAYHLDASPGSEAVLRAAGYGPTGSGAVRMVRGGDLSGRRETVYAAGAPQTG